MHDLRSIKMISVLIFAVAAIFLSISCGGAVGYKAGTNSRPLEPAVTLSPVTVDFGVIAVNATSPAQTVTLTNSGDASLTIDSIATTGDFSQTETCSSTLAAGASCTITVRFKPAAAGTRSGVVAVTDSATGSPHQVSISGTGAAPGQLTVAPASISFGSVAVGQTATRTASVTNPGPGTISVTNASTTGPGFRVAGLTLPLTLTAGKNSTFQISFAPSNAGSASGSLALSNNGTTSPLSVRLSGTGVTGSSRSVDVTWTASASQVVGYFVYRRAQQTGSYEKLTDSLVADTSYADNDVSGGQTYSYVVTAVDADGQESGYSAPALVTVPAS